MKATAHKRTGTLILVTLTLMAALVLWPADVGADNGGTATSGAGSVLAVLFVLVALAVLGVPLFLVMGAVTSLCFLLFVDGYQDFDSFQVFAVKITGLATKNVLLAIPFFVASGAIMSAGSISQRLVRLAQALVGWLPGGLGVSAVFACVMFATISGSSPVTVIAIGSIMLPSLLQQRYPEGFSLGLLTSSGSLGIIIPPSIPLLVYALIASNTAPIDVVELFLAGVVPGLLLALLLATRAVALGVRKHLPTTPFDARELMRAFREGVWALGLPILILGGIYSGLFTATEAAAISVLYALVVELFIHRQLDRKVLARSLCESAVALGALVMIMAFSLALNDFFVQKRIPQLAADWIELRNFSPFEFVIALNVLLLLVGCLMDSISALMILAPLLVPIGYALGLDLIHLGIIFIINLEIGYLTPPIGINLFVASSVFERPLGLVIRGTAPFLIVLGVGLVVMTYVPSLSLGPVNVLLRGTDFYVPFPDGPATPTAKREEIKDADAPAATSRDGEDSPDTATPRMRSLNEMMELMRRQRSQSSHDDTDDHATGQDGPADGPAPAAQVPDNAPTPSAGDETAP